VFLKAIRRDEEEARQHNARAEEFEQYMHGSALAELKRGGCPHTEKKT
jgi:hypothetical protein